MKILKLAVLAAAAIAAQAPAAVITFDFSGAFNTGSRAGQSYSGTIAYDQAQDFSSGYSFDGFASSTYDRAFTISNLKGLPEFKFNSITVEDTQNAFEYDRVTFESSNMDWDDYNYFQLQFFGNADAFSGTGLPDFARLSSLKPYVNASGGEFESSGGLMIEQVGGSGDGPGSGGPAAGVVPEPTTWAMMIGGIGAIGGSLRARRRRGLALAAA